MTEETYRLFKRYIGSGPFFEVPEGTESIGESAFSFASGLRQVVLPDRVREIAPRAFFNCPDLTEVVLPEGLMSLGYGAFMGCRSLRSIRIPESITALPNDCFSHCASLGEVILPGTLDAIGRCAFLECGSLTDMLLPESLSSIGFQAFRGTGIKRIVIPSGVTDIGKGAFSDCLGIELTLREDYPRDPSLICVIFATGIESVDHVTDHIITVTDPETGEEKYSVPMFNDKSDAFMKVITGSWGPGAVFDTVKLDRVFGEIQSFDVKKRTALCRLMRPAGLGEEAALRYRSFLDKNFERVIREAADGDDTDVISFMLGLGIPDKETLERLILYASGRRRTDCCALLMEAARQYDMKGQDEMSLDDF